MKLARLEVVSRIFLLFSLAAKADRLSTDDEV
jgi:hypothetical protein